jgi:Nicotinamide mononucleotide transporter.
MTVYMLVSFVLAIAGAVSIALAGRHKKAGWLVGLCAQPIWIWAAVVTGQYSLVLIAGVYASIYAYNWLRWRAEEHEERGMDSFSFRTSELPLVVKDGSYAQVPNTRYKFYKVGTWTMEAIHPDPHGDSDDNPKYSRNAALAWIAWDRHINKKKDEDKDKGVS